MSFFSLSGRIVRNAKLNGEYTGTNIGYLAVGTGTNHGSLMDVQGPIVGTGVSQSGSWQPYDEDDWKLQHEIARVTAVVSSASDVLYVSGVFDTGTLSGVTAVHEIGIFASGTDGVAPSASDDYEHVMFSRIVRCKKESTEWVVNPKYLTGADTYTLRVMLM